MACVCVRDMLNTYKLMFIVCVIIFKVDFAELSFVRLGLALFTRDTQHNHNNQFYFCVDRIEVDKSESDIGWQLMCYAYILARYMLPISEVFYGVLLTPLGSLSDLGSENRTSIKLHICIMLSIRNCFSASLLVPQTHTHTHIPSDSLSRRWRILPLALLNSWLSWQFYYFWLSYRRSFKCHAFFFAPLAAANIKRVTNAASAQQIHDVDANYWICLFAFVVFVLSVSLCWSVAWISLWGV